jgi:hypothetical protein
MVSQQAAEELIKTYLAEEAELYSFEDAMTEAETRDDLAAEQARNSFEDVAFGEPVPVCCMPWAQAV